MRSFQAFQSHSKPFRISTSTSGMPFSPQQSPGHIQLSQSHSFPSFRASESLVFIIPLPRQFTIPGAVLSDLLFFGPISLPSSSFAGSWSSAGPSQRKMSQDRCMGRQRAPSLRPGSPPASPILKIDGCSFLCIEEQQRCPIWGC